MKYNIPLRNNKKEIIDYTLVSKDDFDLLNKYKWYKDKNGYVQGYVNKKYCFLHRYILLEIHKIKPKTEKHKIVDHINNNPLDNRLENLRFVTSSENAFNTSKKKNGTSIYKGVSKEVKSNKYKVSINIPNIGEIYAYYKNEKHAAHQYNLWIIKYKLEKFVKFNQVEIPTDFINWVSTSNKIIKKSNKVNVYINRYVKNYVKTCKTTEEADKEIKLIKQFKQHKINVLKELLNTIKQKNNDGYFIIKTKKDEEIIIDEELYNIINKYIWYINKDGYAFSRIDKKLISLHRFVIKYNGKDVIDHINSNRLDNRKCNLRITTYAQNGMNKKVSKNSTSKYIGVSKSGNKYKSNITVYGNIIKLGLFTTEIEAAKCRDKATLEHFGEYGKLNFPICENLQDNELH